MHLQGGWCQQYFSDGGVTLELTPSTEMKVPLTIDVAESTEERIKRLISENPVIIFSLSSCFMCHVMRKLLSTLGVHPTVIEVDEEEMGVLAAHGVDGNAPAIFIGGTSVGGLEGLVALHVSGNLVPMLGQVGALRD